MSEPNGLRQRLALPDRLVALADGVFAIVITILVLELAVPEDLAGQSLGSALDELRPTLVAWVISFLITGMYWASHRDLFAIARSVDRDFVWLNLLFLLPVCLIPFAAAVLGRYPDEPVSFYWFGTVMIGASVMRLVLLWYLIRHPELVWPDAVGDRVGLVLASTAAPIVVYVLAMAAAGLSTTLAVSLFFAVPFLYFLLITVLRRRTGTRAEAGEPT